MICSVNQLTNILTVNHVNIKRISLSDCFPWILSKKGYIQNNNNFFSVAGVKSNKVPYGQPIILQNEIGYLGLIRKRICGEMKYLMQYKIEPGNINCIQISPTIQATKSNFTQKHGGRRPAYLDYFLNASKYKIVVDQIQSEQSSRFLGKRNRNIVIELPEDEEIDVLSSHEWMTLEEIKQLMRQDNLVNMDTRTVLSCIPYHLEGYKESDYKDKALFNSIHYGTGKNYLPEVYQYLNNYKMFDACERHIVPLTQLEHWHFSKDEKEFACDYPYSFKVIFCNIEIEGREVKHWCQPLFEATGVATFGLFTCIENDVRLFLVRGKPEIGCFDKIELGPSVQREYVSYEEKTEVDFLFDEKLNDSQHILFDTLLSEEGGRFYHEQNRNVIIEIEKNDISILPEGYFWLDYKTLNQLIQINNTVNIQLRNLLSVLEF